MTKILMELYELLIGLISGIKMQLTYCSQRLGTVVLLFCSMDGAATLTSKLSRGMHFMFVRLSLQVCVCV